MNYIKCPKCGREEPSFDYAHICGPLKVRTKMNERIAKLYDQALVLESNGDYVAGELDPVKFAELIVRECAGIVTDAVDHREPASTYVDKIKQHFGVE